MHARTHSDGVGYDDTAMPWATMGVRLSIHLFARMRMCMSIHWSAHMPKHMSIHFSARMCMDMSMHLSARMTIHMSTGVHTECETKKREEADGRRHCFRDFGAKHAYRHAVGLCRAPLASYETAPTRNKIVLALTSKKQC